MGLFAVRNIPWCHYWIIRSDTSWKPPGLPARCNRGWRFVHWGGCLWVSRLLYQLHQCSDYCSLDGQIPLCVYSSLSLCSTGTHVHSLCYRIRRGVYCSLRLQKFSRASVITIVLAGAVYDLILWIMLVVRVYRACELGVSFLWFYFW